MKTKLKTHFKLMLGTNPAWALKGLLRIYANQTSAEQISERTVEHNNIGFTGADGEFLSSLATQYQRRGSLSVKQMTHVFKKMPKYWAQLLSITPEDKQLEIVAKL